MRYNKWKILKNPENILRKLKSMRRGLRILFAIWKKLYTVGPHTYIFTKPSSIGLNSSFLLVSVL